MENLPSFEAAQAERVGQGRGQMSMQSEQVGQGRGQVSMQSEQVGQERGQVSMQSEQVGQERGQVSMQSELGVTTASMSVEKMKLLLQKSKSGLNARALAPAGKRRKSLGRNALLRILSPRTGCSIGLSSPMRGNGSLSLSALAQDPSRTRPTKRRKLRSIVWKDFEPIYEGSLIVQAKCNHCLEVFAADRENGRSTCHRHMQICKQRIRMNQMVENMRSDSLSTMSPDAMALKNWKFDQEVSREAMVNFIVLQELPFSLVEHEPFQKFIATLNPFFTIVSRTTVVEDVLGSFENRKLSLRETIKASDSRVSLTADFWTSKQNLGYLCITCHFINKEWKLQKRIISFSVVATPHDGLTMFNALLKSLKECHLDRKVFSITLDNAKNNDKMVGYLSQNLRERQLLKGNADILHMRCAAHVLNLIVKDGFQLIESATTHIRDSVKYIRTGQARKQRFEEIIAQLGIPSSKKRPALDVPTRWNSTYLMLVTALEYRTVFETLDSQDLSYMDLPSPDEWKMAGLLCEIFKPFNDATNVVSGSLYPTSHHYFHVFWTVKDRIEKEASNAEQSIATMAVKMKEKF